MRVCSNQFACQRTSFLVHTELRVDWTSHFPAMKQHLAPRFSDLMRHQPTRRVKVLTVWVQLHDTSQLGGPSPVCCFLTPNRLLEITEVVFSHLESLPVSLLVTTPPSQPASQT